MLPSGFSYTPLIVCKRNLAHVRVSLFSNFTFISALDESVVGSEAANGKHINMTKN